MQVIPVEVDAEVWPVGRSPRRAPCVVTIELLVETDGRQVRFGGPHHLLVKPGHDLIVQLTPLRYVRWRSANCEAGSVGHRQSSRYAGRPPFNRTNQPRPLGREHAAPRKARTAAAYGAAGCGSGSQRKSRQNATVAYGFQRWSIRSIPGPPNS